MFWALLVVLFAVGNSQIVDDFNCTTYDTTAAKWVYTPAATICSNTVSDKACEALYVATDYPAPGEEFPRATLCYTDGAAGTFNADVKKVAVDNCAKSCGYCCQTSAYNCRNVQYPRLNCATITAAQCLSATWRTIIAVDCPSACGFCNDGGCVDGVIDCANDVSICNTVGMQDFVNTYCQRTCGRCATTTAASSSSGTGTCSTYIADSSTSCRAWATNGFCTNTFYTVAQRRSYCATTCRIC